MERRIEIGPRFNSDGIHQRCIQTVHAWIIELRSNGAKHRHRIHFRFKQFMIALVLFTYITQRIQCTAFIKLI